jgi:hypothetical protein
MSAHVISDEQNQHYEYIVKKVRWIQKEKKLLEKIKLQVDNREKECLDNLRDLGCPNPTTTKHFYIFCIKENAPCETLHKEMEQIQQKLVRYPYQKRILIQEEFIVLSSVIRHGYLDIIPELLSDDVCNYIDQIDGRTALYDAVKHGKVDMVKQLLPYMQKESIEVQYAHTLQSALDLATGEFKVCIEERLKEL